MKFSRENPVIRITEKDNVAIVISETGLVPGSKLFDGITIKEPVPPGHKVALSKIRKGEAVVRYGVPIGHAKNTIDKGEWVTEKKMVLPAPPDLEQLPKASGEKYSIKPITGYTFEGYRNKDGSVGTRNILAIVTSVQCVAGLAEHLAKKIRKELLPKYPNVDNVVAINHTYGCGVALDTPLAEIPTRTLQNLLKNPNFGNEVMILGLGCEKLRPEQLIKELEDSTGRKRILYMQDPAFHGFAGIVKGAMDMAENHLSRLNRRNRETCPASKLVVGMQCGGSDGLSGITGNPVAGHTADLIVRAGGSVMFSEVTEVRDAIHVLAPRTLNDQVRQALIQEMKWYDDYLAAGNTDRSANPTPGNIMGGLSNVVEKALGSITKSGTTPIVDVIPPGERIKRKGLSFAATPASDFVCGTLQLAAGMNIHVFITGRGTPYGLSMVPVIKVSTNTKLSTRWHDLIDIDTGKVASKEKSIEEMGWELFDYLLEVASGNKQVACDKLGLHNDLVLFNPGPIT